MHYNILQNQPAAQDFAQPQAGIHPMISPMIMQLSVSLQKDAASDVDSFFPFVALNC